MAQNLHSPPGGPPPLRLRKPVRVTTSQHYWIVCQSICYAAVHWTGQRHLLCMRFHGQPLCSSCTAEYPLESQAWLLVQEFRPRGGPALLRLTNGAVDTAPKLTFFDGSLYGRCIEVGRRNGAARAPMYAILHATQDVPVLVEPSEVLPSLKRLLGCGTKPWYLPQRETDTPGPAI